MDNIGFEDFPEGQVEARQLAFICFVHGISKEDLKAMSVPETVDFFESHGLGVDAVAKAFFGRRPTPPDGTTEYQRVISRRLAAIPEVEFTRQVESPNPPTLTALAERGKTAGMPKSPWAAIECAETRDVCETVEKFAKYCERSESKSIARAVSATEAQELRRLIAITDQWLDSFAANLSEAW
jgi:hypothetical protein